MSKYIGVGKFIKPHGIHGELSIVPFNPDTDVFTQNFPLFIQKQDIYSRLKIKKIRTVTKGVLVSIQDIDSIDDAFKFKNKQVFINKADIMLSENEYLISDMFNLGCYNRKDESIGTVSNIYQGDTDIIEVSSIGKTYLIPMTDANIVLIDCGNNKVIVQNEESYKI